jgi:hypothetical protein
METNSQLNASAALFPERLLAEPTKWEVGWAQNLFGRYGEGVKSLPSVELSSLTVLFYTAYVFRRLLRRS